MIVKVQISLFSSEGQAMALIYNEDRTKQSQELATKDLIKLMAGEPKKFFYAEIKNNNFVLGDEAPWQEW